MNNQRKKNRHHWIPQWFLKNWAGDDNHVQVFWINGNTITTERKGPAVIAMQRGLNQLRGTEFEDENREDVEKFSADIDGQGKRTCTNLMNEGVGSLTEDQTKLWAQFLSLMMGRNPIVLQEMEDKLSQDEMRPLVSQALPTPVEQPNEMQIRDASRLLLARWTSSEIVDTYFMHQNWTVVDLSDSGSELLLGDDPLFCQIHVDVGRYLILPLSPTKLFIGADDPDKFVAAFQSKQQLVDRCNHQTVDRAQHAVFGQADQLRLWVQNRVRCSSNRKKYFAARSLQATGDPDPR